MNNARPAASTRHEFEAHFIRETIRVECCEDFVQRSTQHIFSARFTARGDGTAETIAFELAPINCRVDVFRVVDGVRSRKSTREVARDRAREFGGRRFR